MNNMSMSKYKSDRGTVVSGLMNMEILSKSKMWTSMPNLINHINKDIDLLEKSEQSNLSKVKEFIIIHQEKVNDEKLVGDFTPYASDFSITSTHVIKSSLMNNYDIDDQESENMDNNTNPTNIKKSKKSFWKRTKKMFGNAFLYVKKLILKIFQNIQTFKFQTDFSTFSSLLGEYIL